MVIKNISQLAISPLRRRALEIAEAGYDAINTRQAVLSNFKYDQNRQELKIFSQKFNIKNFERVVVIGFGKAALEAVATIQEILQQRIACGFVLDLQEGSLGNIVCRVGTHPHPTKINIEATRELVEMLAACTEKDLVISVVSGGGSALLCDPHDMECETEVGIIAALTAKAATITELNTVRKHISRVKGGRLAQIIYPATSINLIFSDVPKDDISMVASGPTVFDTTTNRDAEAILKKYGVLETLGLSSLPLLESPKEAKYFKNCNNILFVSAKQALLAMQRAAENFGFKTQVFSYSYEGEAREVAKQITSVSGQNLCLLGAGECTVTIMGKGRGGRCQEMALAVLEGLLGNKVFAALASDGHDNSDCAGAIVDSFTKAQAKNFGLDVKSYLEDNDSFAFFEQLGGHIITGQTGSNVSDFFVYLQAIDSNPKRNLRL